MNIMTLNSYKAKIEYDPEIELFRGEILNLNGGADFYGKIRMNFVRNLKILWKSFLRFVKKREYPLLKMPKILT